MNPALIGRSQVAAGTYGKVFDGFDVTDSLPIPRLTGVFAAMENMTFGTLSVRVATVPFGEAEDSRRTDFVGKSWDTAGARFSPHRHKGPERSRFPDTTPAMALVMVSPYVAKSSAGRPGIEMVSKIFVILGEQRGQHRETYAVD